MNEILKMKYDEGVLADIPDRKLLDLLKCSANKAVVVSRVLNARPTANAYTDLIMNMDNLWRWRIVIFSPVHYRIKQPQLKTLKN
jgi:hypothetical protein